MAINPDNTPLPAEWGAAVKRRQARAEHYFSNMLKGQREWYSEKANQQKSRHLTLAITVIVAGAAVSILQVFPADEWIRIATALLGALITFVRALDGLLRPGETWLGYRKASENMKREYRLYINNADAYGAAPDEESAYQLFVTKVEVAIAEEQQLFWQVQAKAVAQGAAANGVAGVEHPLPAGAKSSAAKPA